MSTSAPVKLELAGKIPSFKNNKMLIQPSLRGLEAALSRGDLQAARREFQVLKGKRPMLITKPEYQQRMGAMIASIESQLLSAFQTGSEQTLAASLIRSLIASSMPGDDCWTKVPEVIVRGELCEPGKEGATILIERL